jgi:serine/threonine protein kinase
MARDATRPAEAFGDLLLLDIALLKGHVDGRQAAMALLRVWSGTGPRDGGVLAHALAEAAGLSPADITALRAEAADLVRRHGDARTALDARGGLDVRIRAAVSSRDARVSQQLTRLGTRIRHPLRALPPQRYLDFLPVGQGGMGVVYWALDAEMNRAVAFKVVRPPGPSADAGVTPPAPMAFRPPATASADAEAFEEGSARFLMEAWITGGMEHPGIVPVYEVGQTPEGVPYYTMRFVRGRRTLADALRELQGKPWGERAQLLEPLLKVCDTLRYAHSRGVIHRDLKPDNIALGEFGEVVVLDWGLAKLVGTVDHAATRWRARVDQFRAVRDLRTLTSVIGTPGYLAPEAARGEVDDLDERADIYALGVLLHEILTGALPFDPQAGPAYLRRVAAEAPPPVATLDAAVPEALASLCDRALAPQREDRPVSVDAMAETLRQWQRDAADEGQVASWCREARAALEVASHAEPALAARQLERATTACRRVLDLRAGHGEARQLLEATRAATQGLAERAHRDARRRLLRRGAAAAALLVAVVGAGTAWVVEGKRQEALAARAEAQVARDGEARQRENAEESMRFMLDEVRDHLTARARTDERVRLGERARDHYAALPVEQDTAKRFARRMEALLDLGQAHVSRGHLPAAREAFEAAVARARAYVVVHGDDAMAYVRLAEALVDVAETDGNQGIYQPGLDRVQEALAHLERVQDRVPATAVDRVTARALMTRASLHLLAGAYAEAHEAGVTAAQQIARLPRGDAPDFDLRSLVATVRLTRAKVSAYVAGEAPGLEEAEEAVAATRALAHDLPEDLRARVLVADALAARAHVHHARQELDAALGDLEAAAAELDGVLALRPANRAWVARRAIALFTKVSWIEASGVLGSQPGRQEERRRLGPALYSTFDALLAADPSNARWTNLAISACHTLGQLSEKGEVPGLLPPDTYRERAARLARQLRDLDPTNWRYRLIEAFTLGHWPRASDPAFRDRVHEAWASLAEALPHLPASREVADIFGATARRALLHAARDRDAERLATLAETTASRLLELADRAEEPAFLLGFVVDVWWAPVRAAYGAAPPPARQAFGATRRQAIEALAAFRAARPGEDLAPLAQHEQALREQEALAAGSGAEEPR